MLSTARYCPHPVPPPCPVLPEQHPPPLMPQPLSVPAPRLDPCLEGASPPPLSSTSRTCTLTNHRLVQDQAQHPPEGPAQAVRRAAAARVARQHLVHAPVQQEGPHREEWLATLHRHAGQQTAHILGGGEGERVNTIPPHTLGGVGGKCGADPRIHDGNGSET